MKTQKSHLSLKETSHFAMDQRPSDIRGFLQIFMILLIYQLIHGLVLTGGAIIIYNVPSLRASQHFNIPLAALFLYVATNLILASYAIIVLILMFKKKRKAIINTVILCLLWPLALLSGI